MLKTIIHFPEIGLSTSDGTLELRSNSAKANLMNEMGPYARKGRCGILTRTINSFIRTIYLLIT